MQSWLEGRIWVGKGAQATGMTASLRIQSSKADSNTWESFTRSGLKLESVHQESPRSERLQEKGYQATSEPETTSEASYLGCGEKELDCCSVVQSPLFRWKYILHFKSGEAQNPCCLKSSVKFPQSVMIWAAMSSAGVGPLCFLKSTVNAAIYQEILEHFMLPSADKLYGDADFIFQQDLAPAHIAKGTKSWFNDHVCYCAWLASKLAWPEPHRESMGYCQEEDERHQTQQCRWAEGHCQRNLGFHTTSAVPQTDHLHATPNWGSN